VKPVLLLTAMLALGPLTAGAQDRPTAAVARAFGQAFAEVYEKVAPSVVVLEVARAEGDVAAGVNPWDFFFRDQRAPQRRPRVEESEGSGFIIREDGYILTNAHVIAGADPEGGVIARRQDGSRLPVKIVGVDDKTDLAVLKADMKGLPAVQWGESDSVRVGEFVCGIGAPFELDYTLTVGVISAKGRSNLTSTVYEDYLQTDAAINPGNSGGPLCDIDGRVIGVNTLINGISRGLGFAIPSNIARQISNELIANGRVVRPWLGIRIETLSEQPALQEMIGREEGVLVRTIEPDAPAAQSRLRPADVIVEVDGQPVSSARELQQAILRKKVGQSVQLKVWRREARDGKFLTIAVTTEELPASPQIVSRRPREPFRPPVDEEGNSVGAAAYGLEVQDLPESVAKELGIAGGGIIVTNVQEGSPAELAGLQRQDVITAVGQEPVRDAASFAAALQKLTKDEAAVLLVERRGKKTYAILKP
jgi:Do/DeqQ family serine protease